MNFINTSEEYLWMVEETTILIKIEKQRKKGFFSHAKLAVETITDPEEIGLFIDEYICLIYRRKKEIGNFYAPGDYRYNWGFKKVALLNIWFWVRAKTPIEWRNILTEKGVE